MRGTELLDLMALVDPSYVAAADQASKKKHKIHWRAVAAILCIALCGGLIYIFPFFSPGNPPNPAGSVKPINTPWEYAGNSITVTSVSVTGSYLAQDGTLYSENTDDYLVIIRCKADMAPGWSIAGCHLSETTSAGSSHSALSAPLTEVSEKGEATLILLFSIPAKEFAGSVEFYHLKLQIASGEHRQTQEFSLK